MDMDGLSDGQAAVYRDGRGAIYKFKLAADVFVNMYFTKAGYRRSGDLHDCCQYDVLLRGRARLRILDATSGKESVHEYSSNDFILIPPRTPHLFEFVEDSYLLEWWDDEFKAWYFQPYRDIIERNLPLTDTETANFSVMLPGLQSSG